MKEFIVLEELFLELIGELYVTENNGITEEYTFGDFKTTCEKEWKVLNDLNNRWSSAESVLEAMIYFISHNESPHQFILNIKNLLK